MSCQKKSKSKIQVKKSKTRKHRGGSYASDLVMEASNGPAVMDDYVTNPRVRNGPNADFIGMIDAKKQSGGSAASDMTMENLKDSATTNKYVNGWKVEGDMNSLNTYQPSGGKRNSKSRKSNKRSRKSKNHKSKNHNRNSKSSKNSRSNKNSKSNKNSNRNKNRIVKGGSSDYMASYYSLNSNIKRPNIAWDPPTRDSAGSGAAMGALEGANVGKTGAPLV